MRKITDRQQQRIAALMRNQAAFAMDNRFKHELTPFGREVAKQTVVNKMRANQTDGAGSIAERIANLQTRIKQ